MPIRELVACLDPPVPENVRRAADSLRYRDFLTVGLIVRDRDTEVVKAALCGYVLARYDFPGRQFLHRMIIATLFIPVASIIVMLFSPGREPMLRDLPRLVAAPLVTFQVR